MHPLPFVPEAIAGSAVMNTGKHYFYADEWRTLSEIARIAGVSRQNLHRRMARGMSLEDALDPPEWPRRITFAGKSLTFGEWAKETGISTATLRERMDHHGWPVERALTEPVMTNIERHTRKHNLSIVKHIASAFRAAEQTGGYAQTFDEPLGTGVGRHAHDLESEKPA
jgi:hypothetical protein